MFTTQKKNFAAKLRSRLSSFVKTFESLKISNCCGSVGITNCSEVSLTVFFITDVRVGPELVTDPAFLVTR